MRISKIALIALFAGLMIGTVHIPLSAQTAANDYGGENILYLISPVGRSVYKNCGMVVLDGMKLNLATFTTNVANFADTERIYSDPETLLPYRVERDLSWFLKKEQIIEEYDQKKFTVTTTKYSRGRFVNRMTVRADGPIHNPIMLPFYLRSCPDLKIGWRFIARFPNKFELRLASIENITVPAGTFRAYHFKSFPNRFEIWVSAESPQAPVKIRGTSGFKYALLMKERRPLQQTALAHVPGMLRPVPTQERHGPVSGADFKVEIPALRRLASRVAAAIQDARMGRNSSLQMIKSGPFVTNLCSLEKKESLFLDIGGTNARTGKVTVAVKGLNTHLDTDASPDEPLGGVKKGGGISLFDLAVDYICSYLDKRCGGKSARLVAGVTFSFPNDGGIIIPLAEGVKKFKFHQVMGQNVLDLLNRRLRDRGYHGVRFITASNDTVNVLRLGVLINPDVIAGVVTGTGFNIAIRCGDMLYNLEAGAFTELDGLVTRHDHITRGAEEMISGKFLGELARTTLKGLIDSGEIFAGCMTEKSRLVFDYPQDDDDVRRGLDSRWVSAIASTEDIAVIKRILEKQLGLNLLSGEHYNEIKRVADICHGIFVRSAMINAAMIAGVIQRQIEDDGGPSDKAYNVAVDGALWEVPLYMSMVLTTMANILPSHTHYVIMPAADASGTGAGLDALISEAEHNPKLRRVHIPDRNVFMYVATEIAGDWARRNGIKSMNDPAYQI